MALQTLGTKLRHLSSQACFGWIVRRRIGVILAIGALTLLFLASIPKLVFNTSIYDMVIEDLDETRRYQSFKEVFGADEIIRVVISGQDVFDAITFKKIATLADSLGKIDGVRRTISLPGIKKTVDLSDNWTLETFRQRVVDVPLFRNNLISEDHQTTLITLVLDEGASHEQIIAGCIRGVDTLSRIDTQRFLLLTSGATESDHARLHQRIQQAADRIRSKTDDNRFSIDLSTTPVSLKSAADGDQILECTLSCLDTPKPPG